MVFRTTWLSDLILLSKFQCLVSNNHWMYRLLLVYLLINVYIIGKITSSYGVLGLIKKYKERYKNAPAYKKRGIIYIVISLSFLLYELSRSSPRQTVIFLWAGVILLAIIIMTTLKDPHRWKPYWAYGVFCWFFQVWDSCSEVVTSLAYSYSLLSCSISFPFSWNKRSSTM